MFSFSGRWTRSDWWGFGLAYSIACCMITIPLTFDFAEEINRMPYIINIVSLIFNIPVWAANTKRCHDLGHSGWYQFIPFYCFWIMFAKGMQENNEYGAVPKKY